MHPSGAPRPLADPELPRAQAKSLSGSVSSLDRENQARGLLTASEVLAGVSGRAATGLPWDRAGLAPESREGRDRLFNAFNNLQQTASRAEIPLRFEEDFRGFTRQFGAGNLTAG